MKYRAGEAGRRKTEASQGLRVPSRALALQLAAHSCPCYGLAGFWKEPLTNQGQESA